ncbi:hypothetical protein CIC12_18435 [Burkholderia sp. SG-MS1]|uniref:DUF3999 domain-containing protein n=1 Tax=Paraburkholderia sp. SG-MS1 TaxID=2023741 RepID=UPI0014488890|nr:DUF3999 domain-containing protein [Paraburkholderia sp. SG-MS1]NKJ48680.1 hypothetical protein [Paraburkholderia sp. SG-MS1]
MTQALRLTAWCFAIAAAWTSPPAAAADHFAQRFALQLEDGAAYYSVTLPATVYAASQRNDLGDVRVFNDAGEAVPYSLDTPREPARPAPALRAVSWFPVLPAAPGGNGAPVGVAMAADGSLRATSAPPPRAQHDVDLIDTGRAPRSGQIGALRVHLRDDNYQGRVSIESSDDLRHWQPAGDAQLLKVHYNGSLLSQDRIELDGAHARYLRLHWLDGVPYVESMDAEVHTGVAGPARRGDAQREWREGIVAHAGPGAGDYFFTTGGPYPVDRLRVSLPQPNTVVPAVVYSRAGLDAPWREVSRATLFRLHNGAVEQNNPSLELKPDTDRQWRVVVDTRSGALGSGSLTVAVGWQPATLSFAARGAAPFVLMVGSAAASSAAVARDELLAGAASTVASARLGDVPLPAAQGTRAGSSVLSDAHAPRRYLSWVALALAVSSLGMIAWWLARIAQSRVREVAADVAAAPGVTSAAMDDAGIGGNANIDDGPDHEKS